MLQMLQVHVLDAVDVNLSAVDKARPSSGCQQRSPAKKLCQVDGCEPVPAVLQGHKRWHELITSRLTDTVKLVGPTISCEGSPRDGNVNGEWRTNPHVQSYVLATDQVRTVGIAECRVRSISIAQCRSRPLRSIPCCDLMLVGVSKEHGWQCLCRHTAGPLQRDPSAIH